MEKRQVVKTAQKKARAAGAIVSAIMVFVCLICTILPCSAYVFSPSDSDVYSMPQDFVFSVENREAGILQYNLSGYLVTPLLDVDIASRNFVTTTLETDSIADYYYYSNLESQSILNQRLLSIFSITVDDEYFQNYGEQRFTLTADATVVEIGAEYVNLQTVVGSSSYYNAFVSFDYKLVGSPEIYHYEKAYNSSNLVPLTPQALDIGVFNGDRVLILNYYAEIEYDADPYNEDMYEMQIAVSAITEDRKQTNTALYIDDNDRILSAGGNTPPAIDNVWLLNSVASFFNFEIIPGFSLGGVMGIVFAITVLIAVLKFVAGG